MTKRIGLTSVELCAGGGGQALGLELAGFGHEALVDNDAHACRTLAYNHDALCKSQAASRPVQPSFEGFAQCPQSNIELRGAWQVIEADLREFRDTLASRYRGVDLVAGGVPCPPFSVAGKQLGHEDERDLFPVALEIIDVIRPKAVMLENVRGLLDPAFAAYRQTLEEQLSKMNYRTVWALLNAADFGVPQLRPRVVIVAVTKGLAQHFSWPGGELRQRAPTVGSALLDLMAERGWRGAQRWSEQANSIAPTLVGGSKKHGGPDLGPTRAKRAWEGLGVDPHGLADEAPAPGFVGRPKLTVRMTARLQGFPDEWRFSGLKTNAYRQVGNAFPPPVARAVGTRIAEAFEASAKVRMHQTQDTGGLKESQGIDDALGVQTLPSVEFKPIDEPSIRSVQAPPEVLEIEPESA